MLALFASIALLTVVAVGPPAVAELHRIAKWVTDQWAGDNGSLLSS